MVVDKSHVNLLSFCTKLVFSLYQLFSDRETKPSHGHGTSYIDKNGLKSSQPMHSGWSNCMLNQQFFVHDLYTTKRHSVSIFDILET